MGAVVVTTIAGILGSGGAVGQTSACRISPWHTDINNPRASASLDVVSGGNCERYFANSPPTGLAVAGGPAQGTVEVLESGFRYTPRPGFVGRDGFTLTWYRETQGPQPMIFQATLVLRVNVVADEAALSRPPAPPAGQQARPVQRQATAPAAPTRPAAPARPGRPAERAPNAAASGFFINSAGHVLTNAHVIANCRDLSIARGPSLRYPASVLATDPAHDLAVIGSAYLPSHWARFQPDLPRVGETAVVVGYPLRGVLAFQPNVTSGNISALAGLQGDVRYIQISAPVQAGNSGGPLMTLTGGISGVVSATVNAIRIAQSTGTIPQNVNFAIHAAVARQFLGINRIPYDINYAQDRHEVADIGDLANTFTVAVECYR